MGTIACLELKTASLEAVVSPHRVYWLHAPSPWLFLTGSLVLSSVVQATIVEFAIWFRTQSRPPRVFMSSGECSLIVYLPHGNLAAQFYPYFYLEETI